jgi:hypothetical protein
MTFTEAAALVLRLCGKPLHYKDITEIAIEKSLLSHVGKSPEVTMGSRLNALLKKTDKENPLQRVKPGVFALREWSEEKIAEGLADRRPPIDCIDPAALEQAILEAAQQPEDEEEIEPSAAAHVPTSEAEAPTDDEEKHRAELSHGAQDLFAHEEDDDEPIFAVEEEEEPAPAAGAEPDAADRASKRRRRRRRGRGRREDGEEDTSDDLPTYTVSDAEPDEPDVGRAVEKELPPLREAEFSQPEVTFDLPRVVEAALTDLEKGRNLVSTGALLDYLRRKQKGEPGLSPSALLGALSADNARALRSGGAPRFKIASGKVGLWTWFSDRRVEDARRSLTRALETYRSAQVRALSDQLARLPQRAVGEVVSLLLERMGSGDSTTIRRPGAHGSELHLSTTLKLRGLESAWGSLSTAVVVRKDGRDVGRERVLELRGSLHHYGPAAHGWLITTGQILSGAREEAASTGATPISLTGRVELAELLMDHGLLVQRAPLDFFSLDYELLDSLSGNS